MHPGVAVMQAAKTGRRRRESATHVPQGALTLLGLAFAITWAKLARELVGRLGQLLSELKGIEP